MHVASEMLNSAILQCSVVLAQVQEVCRVKPQEKQRNPCWICLSISLGVRVCVCLSLP